MRENGVSSLVYTNEKCQGCNRCISVCPVLTSNYSVKSGEGQRIEVHGENCINCGVRKHQITGKDVKDEIEYGLGSIYPMPGGLKENVYWFCGEDVFIRQVEGEKHAYKFLQDYKERVSRGVDLPFMVDILNCDKGCIYGSGVVSALEDNR